MPTILTLSLSFAVVCAGVSLALQQVINANLRAALGSPWWAGFASYAVGATAMLILALAAPGPRVTGALLARPPWVAWSGGIFGAVFVMAAILTVPRLGAASVLALVVVGQMLGALAFDQVGLLGMPRHPVSPVRLAGAACLILGVVLVRR